MPVIPTYKRQVSIPGESGNVMQDVGSAGVVGASIAQLGKTGMAVADNLGDLIIRRDAELKKQNDAMAVLKTQNAIDTDTRAFKQTYDADANKSDTDPAGLQDFTKAAVDKFQADLDTKYLANVSSPEQKLRIEAYRNAAVGHILDHTSVYQANARKAFAGNEADKAINIATVNAREGADPLDAMTSAREKITSLHVTGIISAQLAEDAIVKSDQAITLNHFDGLLARNNAAQALEELKSGKFNEFLPAATYSSLLGKAQNQVDKQQQEQAETNAYGAATLKWSDPNQAKIEVLRPEFMKEHKLTINQAQNIAQSFGAIAAQKERDTKERQEAKLNVIRDMAITNPVGALKAIRTVDDVDPQAALALQNALDSHLRQNSLMSAQERSLRIDLEDKIKAQIKQRILGGGYKTEQEVTNAVIREGLTNTSGFLDDALGTFRGVKKDSGAVNFFQQAEQDWDRLISTTKGTAKKRELQDMKPKMLETLRQQMEKDNLRISDPKVFEVYQANRKALTETTFQKVLDAVGSLFGGGDSYVAPKQAPAPPVPSAAMDEATARKRLTEKGVKGADQENWIKRYRAEGVVE